MMGLHGGRREHWPRGVHRRLPFTGCTPSTYRASERAGRINQPLRQTSEKHDARHPHLDLDTVVSLMTATLTLKHPAPGEALRAQVSLAGPDHPTRKGYEWQRTRALRKEIESTGRYAFKEPTLTEQDELDRLAACTLGWSGLAVGGVPLSFSADVCSALYADPQRAWVRDQVAAALDQRELFIGLRPVV